MPRAGRSCVAPVPRLMFQAQGLGIGVWTFGIRDSGIPNPGFGIRGFGFGIRGLGIRDSGVHLLHRPEEIHLVDILASRYKSDNFTRG